MGQTVSECKPCAISDPVNNTVKVDPTLLGGKPMEGLKAEVAGKQQAEVAGKQQAEEERWAQEEQARQEAERQEQERLQAEEERMRQATEEEQRLRRAMEEEEAALEEKRAQEERAFALEAQRLEAEAAAQAAKEKAEAERIQKVADDFLKARGFKNVRTPRKAFCGASIYPLHLAVEENKEDTVRALLRSGADKTQKNSSKLSPLEFAEKLNKNGSHDAVVKLLRA